MADPKTVLQWLETLPKPLLIKCLNDISAFNVTVSWQCKSLDDAIYLLYLECEGATAFYWRGVRHYVLQRKRKEIDEEGDNGMHIYGFDDAKAAFEAQQLPNPETLPDVTYIPVAPDDLAEFQRKADLYNDCKAVIDRLSNEIEDLKLRFK